MGLTYDGKKLIPAPFLAITREANIQEDGKKLDWTYQLTLTAKLCVDKGSPASTGAWHTLTGYPADEVIAADYHRFATQLYFDETGRSA